MLSQFIECQLWSNFTIRDGIDNIRHFPKFLFNVSVNSRAHIILFSVYLTVYGFLFMTSDVMLSDIIITYMSG